TVLHLNHCLRGEESRQDAEFVRELANGLGLPVVVREAEVAAAAHGMSDNLEQAARRARLAFFAEMIAAGGLGGNARVCVPSPKMIIALGHTRSDQAETVLFRFLRPSGTARRPGIRPVTAGGPARALSD